MTTAQSLKIRKRFRSVLYQIIAIGIGLLLVSPILYALVISFMPGEDILTSRRNSCLRAGLRKTTKWHGR